MDLKGKYLIDLYDPIHLAVMECAIHAYQPELVILSPCCRAWCKKTDFVTKLSKHMARLIQERAVQTKLMSNIVKLIHIIVAYGGHILMKTPRILNFGSKHL